MIKHMDQKQTAKQYMKRRFWDNIVGLMDFSFDSDEELMNDENFIDIFHWLTAEPSDLRKMTLKERKEVISQFYKQGERLLKVVS
jgi:hypothetical protein